MKKGPKKITLDDLDIMCDGSIFYKDKPKKFSTHSAGYFVTQCDGKLQYVHRLVAQKYIPNPEGKTMINHIDGNKQNNNINNLEWVTIQENLKHARETGLWSYNHPYKHTKRYEEKTL